MIAVIEEESTAFFAADFERWAKCWVQDEQTLDLYSSLFSGFVIRRGWTQIREHVRQAFDHELFANVTELRRENLQVRIEADVAWVVFDQHKTSMRGFNGRTFETRILLRQDGSWRIAYCALTMLDGSEGGGGSIAIDAEGRVLDGATAGLSALGDHPHLTISAGRLRATRRHWDEPLQEAIRNAGSYHTFFKQFDFMERTGGDVRFPAVLGEDDAGGAIVLMFTVRGQSTIVEFDQAGSVMRRLAQAQAVFGLSAGQIAVAEQIVRGQGLTATAGNLGISVNTARTHLSRIYEKTGVNSQTALVRLLLSVG